MNKSIISYLRRTKLIQLIIVVIEVIAFFAILSINTTLRKNLYTNTNLLLLCAAAWVFLLLQVVFIFIDFFQLNHFNNIEDEQQFKHFMEESKGMLNRFSMDTMFKSEEVAQVLENVGCSMIEISNLREANEQYGRDAGDRMIDDFCQMLESVGNDYGIVVRNGGNEFLIVIADCTTELMEKCLEELDNSLAVYNQEESPYPITINSTYVLNSEHNFQRFSEVLTLAYRQLHK